MTSSDVIVENGEYSDIVILIYMLTVYETMYRIQRMTTHPKYFSDVVTVSSQPFISLWLVGVVY
jgi:hypothetical protein